MMFEVTKFVRTEEVSDYGQVENKQKYCIIHFMAGHETRITCGCGFSFVTQEPETRGIFDFPVIERVVGKNRPYRQNANFIGYGDVGLGVEKCRRCKDDLTRDCDYNGRDPKLELKQS